LEVLPFMWKDNFRTRSISDCGTFAIADVHRHAPNNSVLSPFGEGIVGMGDWDATEPWELSKDLSIIVTTSNRFDGHLYNPAPFMRKVNSFLTDCNC
jgi:hypothetical protein